MNTHSKRAAAWIMAALPLAGLGIACDRDKEIRSYSAPKEAAPAGAPAESTASLTFPGDLRWTLPAGWAQVPVSAGAGAMFRPDAAIQASSQDPKLLLTVSHLGDAPGARELMGNVNRWAGQVQLPAFTSESELMKVVTHLNVADVTMDVVDLNNEPAGKRMLAAIVPHGRETWFFKLAGTSAAVGEQRSAFDEFMRSVKFEGSAAALTPATAPSTLPPPAATGTATPAASEGVAGARWTLPAGWLAEPGANEFRLATVRPAGNAGIEIKVSKFKNLGGGVAMNVARWRGEVGLPPADNDAAADAGQSLDLGGQKWTIRDYAGPAKGGSRSVIASVDGPDGATWFFKMSGPSDAVGQQKADFDKYLASVRFGQ